MDAAIRARLAAFAEGIAAYRKHPWRRDLADPPAAWRDGTTRLLDFGPDGGRPVLFVPSLVNRSYILDLSQRRSMLRWMAAETGLRPLLVDWDAPGPEERGFTLGEYVSLRLEPALETARALDPGGRPVPVVGYCMGGLLALALGLRRADAVSGLALLATPWDFHAERVAQAEVLARAIATAEPALEAAGELPVDVIQALFSALDPFLVPRKFVAFSAMDPASQAAEDFVALEDWLNDGVPLAAPVAAECLGGWYGRNTPHRGAWAVEGRAVDPAAFDRPALVLIPQQDRIVPPASARALAAALPHADTRTLPLGHIGMVAGGRAKAAAWEPLAAWLATL